MVGPSRRRRVSEDHGRLHLQMGPPPEPTWRSLSESQRPEVTPVARVFIAIAIVCAILGLLFVASFVMYGLIAGDPGCCG
jgi:hypothetical protein